MNRKNLCTILISSCDTYSDLWEPFFTILKNEWQEVNDYKIILNTESMEYHFNGLDVKCLRLYKKGEKIPWGTRLIETLKRIESKYIIFLLDDFFLTGSVDQKKIDCCLNYMEENNNIAVFCFVPSSDSDNMKSDKYPGFELRNKTAKWRLNTQAAIWRRDKLISYIRPHESAWDWEIYGSERSKRYTADFYVQSRGEERAFQYEDSWGGAIHRGKWTPYAIMLCEKYNINIDFGVRGIETKPPPYDRGEDVSDMNFLRRIFRPPFLKRLKKYLYMWMIEFPKARITRYRSLR
jgi:hypothetical protein